ncbi:MAG TPA: HxsD-like protein [Nannocystaceae bacterium]|nr:HxsD-like protein [Nannocystaceae bacterium]
MIELRFHRELYAGTAIDAALARLAGFASFERSEDGSYFVVRVSASSPARARKVAGELGNFALGLTVEGSGPDEGGRQR